MMDEDAFRILCFGISLIVFIPFFVSNAAMVSGSKVLNQEVEKNPPKSSQKSTKKYQNIKSAKKVLKKVF